MKRDEVRFNVSNLNKSGASNIDIVLWSFKSTKKEDGMHGLLYFNIENGGQYISAVDSNGKNVGGKDKVATTLTEETDTFECLMAKVDKTTGTLSFLQKDVLLKEY